MDWSREEITELIDLYRQYECLWNYDNENYTNYDVKQSAWLDIASACDKELSDIKKKVKNLRSAYVMEKKKLEASKNLGVEYTPNLFYYHNFTFLDNIVVIRKKSFSPSVSTSFLTPAIDKSGDESSQAKRKHKTVKFDRRSIRESKFNHAIDAIVASVNQTPPRTSSVGYVEEADGGHSDVFDSFGKTTALQLQQLPLDKATEAMAAIYQLVAKKTLDSLKKSRNESRTKHKNGVISFETMSP